MYIDKAKYIYFNRNNINIKIKIENNLFGKVSICKFIGIYEILKY